MRDELMQIIRALPDDEKEQTEERIKQVIENTIRENVDPWYDLLMNGTNGASDKTLEILGIERTYET